MKINILPESIRSARRKRGWTGEKLAKESGLSQSVVSKMEGGKSLTLENLLKVSDALSMSLDELVCKQWSQKIVEDVASPNSSLNSKLQHLEELNELKDQSIARLDREVVTNLNYIEQLEDTLAKLKSELDRYRDS